MKPVTIRLPDHMIEALDEPDGPSRSQLVRDAVTHYIEEGHIEELPERYQTLAKRERAISEGRMNRERGKFRHKVREFFASRWQEGSTPEEAEAMSESFRAEAELYGDEYERFIEAVAGYYADEWVVTGRGDFPTTDEFTMMARGGNEPPEEAVEHAREIKEGALLDYSRTVEEVAKRYPLPVARNAAGEVFDADEI